MAGVEKLCAILDYLVPKSDFKHSALLTFVKARPGHDRRYAIDSSKISRDLGWQTQSNFDSGLLKTVQWYLSNSAWVEQVRSGAYQNWLKQNYENRKA